jgi:tetratricopeptide (TPR) repeat protein
MPMELERIVNKCLKKSPGDRYQHIDELIVDLRSLRRESTSTIDATRFAQVKEIEKNRLRRLVKPGLIILTVTVIAILYFTMVQKAESKAPIPIAVVDFINETGENELNGLSGMLTTALEQSKRLSVITRSRMFDILKQLDKENVEFIDENLGREIANHAGIKVLVLASINKFDQLYNIDLKIIDPMKDKYLFAASMKDKGKENIPVMIDRLAERTREGLEESEEDIQQASMPIAEMTTPNLEAYQHYFKGQEYIDKVMFEEAEKEFEKAIELDSTFGLAYYRLAYAINWEEDSDRAKEPINMAFKYIEKIPDKEKYFVRTVKVCIDSGWGDAALNTLREMEKIYPGDKEMMYNIGDILWHIGEFTEAKNYLEKVLEMDSKSIRTLQHLLWTYRDLGDYDQMLRITKKYILVSGSAESYGWLAERYAHIDSSKKVYEVFTKVLKDNPNDVSYIHEITLFLFARRLHYHAAWYLDKIEEIHSDYWKSLPVAQSYSFRGHINMFAGKFEQAEIDFKRALALEPEDVYSLFNYAHLLLALKRYDDVREIAVKLENHFYGKILKATLYAVEGEKEKALSIEIRGYNNTRIYLLLEMKDKSLQSIINITENSLKRKTSYYTGLTNWPIYDFLRDDPRFQEILARHKQVYDENLQKYGDLVDLIKE